MIQLGDITDSILNIKDLVKLISIRDDGLKIEIDDFKVLHQFESIFCKDSFRKSARNYRNLNGRENLNEELALILKAISYFSKFYDANQMILDQVNKDDLITREVEFYNNQVQLVNREIVKLNKKISDVSTQIEILELTLNFENLEYDNLILMKTGLIGEHTSLKLKKIERQFNHKKQTSLYSKTSSFSEISKSYSILKIIIEDDFQEPRNLFPDKFSKDSLEIINSIFEPSLDENSARKLFNKIHSSGLNIKYKYRKKLRACNLIYQLSETIKDEELKSLWINDILNYFVIDEDLYDKKKTSSKLMPLMTN